MVFATATDRDLSYFRLLSFLNWLTIDACASSAGCQREARQVGENDDGLLVEARWNVAGSVGHWGHIHQRTNAYHARLMLRDIDGAWKLTGLDILEEERL